MSFKKSKQKSQPDLFATASYSLPGVSAVDGSMCAPTKQLRIHIAMRISDQLYRQKAQR